MKSEATIINLLSGFWLKKKNLHVCYFLLTISFILLANGCRTNKPDAQFTASTEVATVGETIYFTNSSSHASYYQWAFGDGDAAVTKDASHAYEKSGIYTVTLVAIGHENANSASKEITVTGDITIFAGKGISEASLGDTWDTVFHKFPSEDTICSVDYINGYYLHYIYYYKTGIIILFANDDPNVIYNDDQVIIISLITPYFGYTAKGITLGDNISKAKAVYGTPGKYKGSNFYTYYYDTLGIQFFTSLTSPTIEEIDVYYSSLTASSILKSLPSPRLLRKKFNRGENRLLGIP